MSGFYLGEIRLFPYNFAPRSWAFCAGQILPIAQNTALFSLLGTTYGGNGQTTFALPDLRGRVAMSSGQGPGLSSYTLGEVSGQENVTLIITQMPAHNHIVGATNEDAGVKNPSNALLAVPGSSTYNNTVGANVVMNPGMIQPSGGSQPHENMQPFLILNYCIALEGIFPSRN
ncbi:MAG TPA: tail fiber protein [Iamia sp.]